MRYFVLTTATAVLLTSTGAVIAQDTDAVSDQAYVNVDGAAVQVSIALAAEACGMEEAEVAEAAALMGEAGPVEGADATTAMTSAATEPVTSNEMVTTGQGTADPSTATPGDEMLAFTVCEIDVEKAGDLGIPQANEIVTE